jgi:hypothetical protein
LRASAASVPDALSTLISLLATTKAAILPDLIMVFDVSIPINVGDEVRPKLPSGLDDTFEAVDPRFFEKLQGVKAHRANIAIGRTYIRNLFYVHHRGRVEPGRRVPIIVFILALIVCAFLAGCLGLYLGLNMACPN